jgi:DNA-binding SARP family transcriptional activator
LFHYFSAWTSALRKDLVGAYQDLREALALALEVDMPFLEIVCRSALAQVLFGCGDGRKGSAQLRKVHALARDSKNPLLEFMTLLTYAQIAFDQGRKRPALNALQYALGLGREYAFKHVLWWQPDVMSRLCMCALEAGMEEEYVRGLIVARDLFPEAPPWRLANWPWRYRIISLGKFLLSRDGEAIMLSSKAQGRPVELLKTLIALGGRDVRADQLAQKMWPHVDTDYAYRSFTTALHRLRRLLGADEAVLLQEGRVTLSPRLCWVDIWALDQVLDDFDTLIHNPKLSLDIKVLNDIVAEVLRYYQGAFLEDELDQTVYALYREQIRNRLRRNLAQLSTRLEESVGFDTVVGLYEKLIDSDPLAEGLYRDLMQRYAVADRRADALEIFDRCRNALRATRCQPSAETMAAYEEIVNAA